MSKYTELSDFEINLKVAHIMLGKDNYDWCPDKKEVYLAGIDGGDFLPHGYFDPCKNPSDAMPIIIENKICTAFDVFAEEHDGGNWVASPAYGFASERTRSNNLYRAAMELFLLINDAENNQ